VAKSEGDLAVDLSGSSSVKSIKMSSDHSDEDINCRTDPLGEITNAIDPSTKTFYVAAGNRKGDIGSLRLA
jgi:hypothetical protein